MKTKTIFICQECGFNSTKWLGRCPECSNWNCLVEELGHEIKPKGRFLLGNNFSKPEKLCEVIVKDEQRIKTGINEFDHVLGAGIVEGSVVLIGGAPGIGKSTLLLQVCNALSTKKKRVLYISAEESARQTRLRADRLGTMGEQLYILSETNLELILEHVKKISPEIIIMDSIQVVYLESISSAAGSVSQVRECAANLTSLAKNSGISVFLVGHVTKDGSLAGPRVLEHLVDCVLYFEGERHTSFRILRAIKNRFGSTNEIGIFEMTSSGLMSVDNPSQIFLTERLEKSSGSTIVATIEGTRPLLVEIQALVSQTNFGLPTRRSTGIDFNRVALLIAVLEKRGGFSLQNQDVFINAVGGVKILEPAADLAVVSAIASSFKEKYISAHDVIFGEVGLGGEIRAVTQVRSRINEAEKLGFKRVILPQNNLKNLEEELAGKKMVLAGVSHIKEAFEIIFK